jgi:CheY-like chemotaxis protein
MPRWTWSRLVRRILVVEDESHIRDFLVEFLTACGHRVESAGNGSEAFTLLTERSFALILTDLHMPEMDGEALYQKIAQTWQHLVSRVVFLTSGVPSSTLDVFPSCESRSIPTHFGNWSSGCPTKSPKGACESVIPQSAEAPDSGCEPVHLAYRTRPTSSRLTCSS